MRTQKERYFQGRILDSLLRHDIVTVSMLAEEAGISENSVRSRLDRLDVLLAEQELGKLSRKAHVGIWLEANDRQRRELRRMAEEALDEQEYISSQDLRRDEVVRLIFQMKKREPLTLASIGGRLYLSPQAVKKSFRSAADWFRKNDIIVQAVQNKGIMMETDEANYRYVLKNYLLQYYSDHLQSAVSEFFPGVSADELRQCLVDEENIWRLEFSDYSFREIWLYLCIAVYRMSGGYYIEGLPQDEADELTKHKEYEFAAGLVDMYTKRKGIEVPWAEVLNLAKIILCSGIAYDMPGGQATDDIFEYDAKLRAFARDVVATMSVVLGEDLTDDAHFYDGLLQHLRPAIFRMRYGYEKIDDTLDYTKQEYRNTYRAAWSTSTLFEEYFNVKVTEEELLYITLYAEVALERRNRQLKAVLIVPSSDIHAQLACMKIRKAIPRICELEPMSLHGFNAAIVQVCDVVFTQIDGVADKIPLAEDGGSKVIRVPRVFTDEAELELKQQVRNLINRQNQKEEKLAINSIPLLDPDLILIHSELTDKEEIIRRMVDRLVEGGYVLPDYFRSVMERENTTTTAIGNGVAIPHGFSSGVNQSKVCICTLKQPIRWNDEMVDVIFLLAIKSRTVAEANDMRQFYKYFIKLTDTYEKVNVLRGIGSSAEMYKYLIS